MKLLSWNRILIYFTGQAAFRMGKYEYLIWVCCCTQSFCETSNGKCLFIFDEKSHWQKKSECRLFKPLHRSIRHLFTLIEHFIARTRANSHKTQYHVSLMTHYTWVETIKTTDHPETLRATFHGLMLANEIVKCRTTTLRVYCKPK